VAARDTGVAAGVANRCSRRRGGALVHVEYNDARAPAREESGDRRANPGAGAGDSRDLAVKIEHARGENITILIRRVVRSRPRPHDSTPQGGEDMWTVVGVGVVAVIAVVLAVTS